MYSQRIVTFVNFFQSYTKEHLVFTNADGIVYHYVIEGTSMKDGSRVPPEVIQEYYLHLCAVFLC